MASRRVNFKLILANERAWRALKVICETLADIEEDFGYRDDVKRAVRAGNYLLSNIEFIECDAD